MASNFDIHVVALPVVLTGATEIPIVQLPSGGGGLTVLSADFFGAGTSVGGKLVTLADGGTPAANGTIGAFAGTVTGSATVPAPLTISDGYVAGGEWIGFDQTSGTVTAGSFVSLSYVMGK